MWAAWQWLAYDINLRSCVALVHTAHARKSNASFIFQLLEVFWSVHCRFFWAMCTRFWFGSKLGFSRILDSLYGAFWQCSRVGYNRSRTLKVNRFWLNLEHSGEWVHCRGLALVDFGGDSRSSESWRARRNFYVFLSVKQRTLSPISRQPNFTTFERSTSVGVAMKTFATEFWKFYRKGSFFQKTQKIIKNFNVLLLTSDRHNSAMITDRLKFITKIRDF